jgi:hypothetical protein
VPLSLYLELAFYEQNPGYLGFHVLAEVQLLELELAPRRKVCRGNEIQHLVRETERCVAVGISYILSSSTPLVITFLLVFMNVVDFRHIQAVHIKSLQLSYLKSTAVAKQTLLR